jgi:hypothetical protein
LAQSTAREQCKVNPSQKELFMQCVQSVDQKARKASMAKAQQRAMGLTALTVSMGLGNV